MKEILLAGLATKQTRAKKISRAIAANFMLVAYTSSVALTAATPVLAQELNDSLKKAPVVEQLPLEPDTQFDANRWYDRWWDQSVAGLKNIPGQFVKDMQGTYGALKSVFNNGVKVGNTLIIRGGPDTGRILKYHAKQMGIHYRDTIKLLPEHATIAKGLLTTAAQHAGKKAVKNAKHTAAVAKDQGQKIAEDQRFAWQSMKDLARWSGRKYKQVVKQTGSDIAEDAGQTRDDVVDAATWTKDQTADAFGDTVEWMKDYAEADLDLARTIGEWTVRQAPEGYRDTVRWTKNAAKATGRWTKAAANWTGDQVSDEVSVAGGRIVRAGKQTKDAVVWTLEKNAEGGEAIDKAFSDATTATVDATFGKIPASVKSDVARTKKSAKWLWKKGYEEGLKGGLELAGDNYFAGDVEGIVVGSFYSMAAVAEGVGYVLVLEPLAFTGNVGIGVTKTVGLGLAGAAGVAGVTGAYAATKAVTTVAGATMTVGVAALGGAYTAGTAVAEGLAIAGKGTIGGIGTAGAAVVGGIYTAGAAGAGVVRTVGGMTVGALSTALVGGPGLIGGEAVLAGAGAVRMAGTAIAGTAMTAGALALGGLKITKDLGEGTIKMIGVTAATGIGEVLIPTIDAAVTVGRLGKVAGTAIVDNLIMTPAVATFDILTALTLGGWFMLEDPILGTYHMVAGATGFSYRLVGLTSALAVTAVAGTLYAVAKAPLSLVYYGGMWSIAAGGKLIDKIIAPFAFDHQNHWKRERKPQLEDMLGKQDRSITDEIGDDVTYIRVIFSGADRGKVNFFTTEKDGHKFKFKRHVQGNCLVVYKSKDTSIVLNSKLYDRRCIRK